jgi:Family of unknown function (DUF6279)
MTVALLKSCRSMAALSAALWLASCSAMQLSYNNVEVWLRWKADRYFDLQPAQEADLRVIITHFHDWHRAHELPLYSDLMGAAARRLEDGLSEQDLVWAVENIRTRYEALIARAVADGAVILLTLSPEQLTYLADKLADDNRKYAEEFLPESEEKRIRVRATHIEAGISEWTGSLSDGQERRIAAMARDTGGQAATKLAERERNQREFFDILKSEHTAETLVPRLSDLLENWESRRSPAQASEAKMLNAQFFRMMIDLDHMLTPAQRASAVARLQGYAADFAALAEGRGIAAHLAEPVGGG